MSKKDLLKQKARAKLATSLNKSEPKAESVNQVVVIGDAELSRVTMEIKASLEEMQDIFEWWQEKKSKVAELKQFIIEKLIYVRNNKKKLLPSRTFEDYLVSDIGISKGYFYEQLQAYNICMEYKKPGLFQEVDHKVLVNIAREKDKDRQKELIDSAKSLSRDDFKKDAVNPKVSPTDFLGEIVSSDDYSAKVKTPASAAINLIKKYKEMMDEESKEEAKSSLRCMILGVQSFSVLLHDQNFISGEDLSVIKELSK